MPVIAIEPADAHDEILRLTRELERERLEVRRWRIVALALAERIREVANQLRGVLTIT